jgi:hypothetical protein
MLVCNVSLRAPRRAIAAGVIEAATAVDASATGNIVFATLVDDPANVTDTVNAYLGEIMHEATSAADVVSAGSVATAAIDEGLTATESVDGSTAGVSTRSALLAAPWPVFVNPGLSREANINGIMVNQ